jgi:phosphatidylglycerol lysyltransferase
MLGALLFVRRWPAVDRLTQMGGDRIAALAPRLFSLITFIAGTILLVSGATPARAGRLGWVDDLLPLPVIEASAYLGSIAGIGLIILARGLQRRLDAAYHLTVWLLAGGAVFALASAFDVEQALALSIMLLVLLPSRRFFYRRSSILEERFTRGWVIAIGAVVVGTIALTAAQYGSESLGADELFHFSVLAQGARAQRALFSVAAVLLAFGAARLLRPARIRTGFATAEDLAAAEPIVAASPRASAQLAFLGDKKLMFNEAKTACIMYGVAGLSWVSLGDPIGSVKDSIELINKFVTACDRNGGWPVFYRVPPQLLYLYLDYALAAVKLGEVARVSLPNFSLEGPHRRNLRYVSKKSASEGCTFEMIDGSSVAALVPELRRISDSWLHAKSAREKGFSLGRFDPAFFRRGLVGVVRLHGHLVAFITLWRSGTREEIEVDLMRYDDRAPPSIMRYALTEAMLWAKAEGYTSFNLGAAPLSGIRTAEFAPVWNQVSAALRGAGEKYYNFKGLREFKEWFHPEWEPMYLLSPGGVKRPLILANIARLVSGGVTDVFRR